MRAVCQRVSEARVTVDGAVTGEIGVGLAVFVGIERTDEPRDARELARKVAHLRIFEDDRGKFAHSLLDTSGSALVVSQFTLVADTDRGNRPSFTNAAPPEEAEPLYEEFCAALAAEGTEVETGVFGARMAVALVNEGPVTIVLG
ncbi:MAG: D-aminoacyl-tRNA deacylase [Actinomycetota bacterium]|nr:D-aminoacyl-tRNA deacylase [Actinomycetota bacterium]